MNNTNEDIQIYGKLVNVSTEGIVTDATSVWSERCNKNIEKVIEEVNIRNDQITETLRNIAVTGGASVASAVTYDNTTSQLISVNIQGAIDELQQSKIDKLSIVQKSGDAEDKVMSQKVVSNKLSDLKNMFVVLGEDEYDSIKKDESKIYFVYEEEQE